MRRIGDTRTSVRNESGTLAARGDPGSSMLAEMGTGRLSTSKADVGVSRERSRRRRLRGLFLLLLVPAAYFGGRWVNGDGIDVLNLTFPEIDLMILMPALFFLALILVLVGSTLGAGRSPHVTYRPEQIVISLDQVVEKMAAPLAAKLT